MVDVNYVGKGGFNWRILLLTIFFLLIISLSPPASADVISVNAGGSENLSVSSDKYIEGFFFSYSLCGDGFVEGWEACDDGNSVNTDACLNTCVAASCGDGFVWAGVEGCDDGNVVSGDGCSNVCVVEAAPPGPGPGGGGAVTTTYNLFVNPSEFNINLAINTNVQRTIKVTNLGSSSVTISVGQSGLDNMVILERTSMTIASGQTQDLNVVFVALNETGIYTGTIRIGNRQVLVSLNVKTKLLLFDSNIVVLNKNYQVPQGRDLRTLITLIPLGDPDRLDVTLNFVIKDYRNKVYLTKSETLLIEKQMELKRNFDTGILPLGDYIVGLELIYPDGVAPSSAHFEVIPPSGIFGRMVLFLLILILLILILIIIILIIRRLREMRKQRRSGPIS